MMRLYVERNGEYISGYRNLELLKVEYLYVSSF